MKKKVIFHPGCESGFLELASTIQAEFGILFEVLERDGYLREPYAKKLSGYDNLFELRIMVEGNWRLFYGYVLSNKIVMLHLIYKKTQKTRDRDIKLSLKRLKDYE